MRERDRIATYFAPLCQTEPGSFALTDDAALVTPPHGHALIVTTDSVIQAVHVMPDATAKHYAQKLVRRNLSDLAAMGAAPWRYTLNLHTPHWLDEAWFAEFTATLREEQEMFGMVLIGGDSTSMPQAAIHATMTCLGLQDGAPLTRSGAQVGDDLYISGTIGDAAFGLLMLEHQLPEDAGLIARYHTPQPRLELGKQLRTIAHAAMDVSDGLMADIMQLCSINHVGAVIEKATIPCSPMVQFLLRDHPHLWDMVLGGGDDYELCFTAPESQRETIAALSRQLTLPLTRIGRITEALHVSVLNKDGSPYTLAHAGYSHA